MGYRLGVLQRLLMELLDPLRLLLEPLRLLIVARTAPRRLLLATLQLLPDINVESTGKDQILSELLRPAGYLQIAAPARSHLGVPVGSRAPRVVRPVELSSTAASRCAFSLLFPRLQILLVKAGPCLLITCELFLLQRGIRPQLSLIFYKFAALFLGEDVVLVCDVLPVQVPVALLQGTQNGYSRLSLRGIKGLVRARLRSTGRIVRQISLQEQQFAEIRQR